MEGEDIALPLGKRRAFVEARRIDEFIPGERHLADAPVAACFSYRLRHVTLSLFEELPLIRRVSGPL